MTDPTPPYISARKPIHHTVPFNGASIYTTFWPVPEGQQIKGRLIYIHGFSEYHALDVMFFDRISNQGYEVFTYDQRGAGLTSTGADKGISNEFHVFNDLDFIIERNIEELKGTNRKLHLFGFSMGGGIVLNYGVKGRYKDSFETIIAIGSVISVDVSYFQLI
ncbi:hypothetical protein WICMUC_002348 [Wickerhamomyces mucosus]|uniref:Serine aminopeptidase S33 domain-containing protein n=1 Tax=Wickerhamomyces mucosus TaxID=1378264 RepID=A0A9P8TEM3_9ASCO|nr:hypothetical protein WICMUC_002348 [Wickerhamomyces mucosus]